MTPDIDPAGTRPEPETVVTRRGGSIVDGRRADVEAPPAATAPKLPPNYRLEREHERSSYHFLYWTDPTSGEEHLVAGPANDKWQGIDAAIQAAVHHAEVHASAATEVSDG